MQVIYLGREDGGDNLTTNAFDTYFVSKQVYNNYDLENILLICVRT